ncbi:MAG: diacylglycerol kinase family protein [Candidatus Acidiferrales bacterium]
MVQVSEVQVFAGSIRATITYTMKISRRNPRRTLVIVNPVTGEGRAHRAEKDVASYLALGGEAADFVRSTSPDDVREKAARATHDGYTHVVALGGDGTFHYVIEGIHGTDAIAGFFPAGGGNDIAAALGIPNDPVLAAEQFVRGRARSIDLVEARFADGRVAHFIGVGGMGLDAEAAHLANTRYRAWPGASRYLAGAFRTFFREGAFELRAEIDGAPWNGRALFAAVGNGTSYGAGVKIAPDARVDDGWLDVAIVADVTLPRLLEALPHAMSTGDLCRFPEVQRFRCKSAMLASSRSARVHGDGEALGSAPVAFTVLPHAVRVVGGRASAANEK